MTSPASLWPKLNAGQTMTKNVPTLALQDTVGAVVERLRQDISTYETIDYLYVLDQQRRLVKVLSVKDLYRYPATELVQNIKKGQSLIAVRPQTSLQVVAHQALENKLHHLPVIDKHGSFLGSIPVNDIIASLEREGREDIMRVAGVHPEQAAYDDILKIPIRKSLWHRLPWLFLGLLGGLFVARLIDGFVTVLEKNIVFAAFIPLVVYMSDAVGTQMEAFAIRDFAVHEKINYLKYFGRQLIIVILIALISSAVFFAIGLALYNDLLVTVILAISLLIAIASSLLTGLLIPLICRKIKLDPANASGPIATILQNVLSVVIYFGIASWLLK